MRPTILLFPIHLLAAIILLHGVIGCLPHPQAPPHAQADATKSRCHRPLALGSVARDYVVLQKVAGGTHAGSLVPSLSRETQRTAAQIGLLDLLEAWPPFEEGLDKERYALAMISLRQAVSHRLALAASAVMSTRAAIDCEAARSDHVADALIETHQEISKQALFAVFASDIFIGILPGSLMLAGKNIAVEASQVFGGVAGTGFGSVDAVLHIDQNFQHPRNFLRELWEGPDESQLFPPSIWRFLNDPSEENPHQTVREALLARWHAEGRWDKPHVASKATGESAILFGDGGQYGERLLRMRAEMLRQLGSEVLHLGLSIHRVKYEMTQWLDEQMNDGRNTACATDEVVDGGSHGMARQQAVCEEHEHHRA